MPNRIRDLLVLVLPAEWRGGGIGIGADSPGPPGAPPPPRPPGPPPDLWEVDVVELRMIAQLLLARLGGPVTLGEMEPRSLTEVDDLESRLTAALEDLKAARAELEES